MERRYADGWSRREFLGMTVAGTAGLLGIKPEPFAAEPPPETTKLRLVLIRFPSICQAPQYVAEELLKTEGFADVQYVKKDTIRELELALASGEADFTMHFAAPIVIRLDAGDPIVILAGIHIGCFELFGGDRVRAIRDLQGKTVAVPDLRTGPITFLASMAAYVGLARKDINWVTHPPAEAMQLLAEGKIDAYLGFPPDPQELRAKAAAPNGYQAGVTRYFEGDRCLCPSPRPRRPSPRGEGLYRALRLRPANHAGDPL
jgi:NitT/TauT family transport system substrate-binding protein